MNEFEEHIAPNYSEIELCPYCGAELSQSAINTDEKISIKLDKELDYE